MGREALATCNWQGETTQVKALLEATEIILRGDVRLRLLRQDISSIHLDGETLTLGTRETSLVLTFQNGEAKKWSNALEKPPPTLAEKLGIGVLTKVHVIGHLDDATLRHAVENCQTQSPANAALFLACLGTSSDLDSMLSIVSPFGDRHVWCVYPKGKHASVTDGDIRNFMRGHGYIDSKTSGISDRLTATRYRLSQL
jgi:hypothetical protein